jgi:hypothetical protein
VQQVFPCQVSPFPLTYLGAPLSIRRLRCSDEQCFVDAAVAKIPTWKAGLLTKAGCSTLTKTTLSAIPVHVSICCCLSAWAIGQIDKRRRAFLWSGTESTSGGKCKIAWSIVCAPTEYGGLGITDLRILGFTLLKMGMATSYRTGFSLGAIAVKARKDRLLDVLGFCLGTAGGQVLCSLLD